MKVKLLYGVVEEADIREVFVEVCRGDNAPSYHVVGVFSLEDGEHRGCIDLYETLQEAFVLSDWLSGMLDYEYECKMIARKKALCGEEAGTC